MHRDAIYDHDNGEQEPEMDLQHGFGTEAGLDHDSEASNLTIDDMERGAWLPINDDAPLSALRTPKKNEKRANEHKSPLGSTKVKAAEVEDAETC